MHLQDGGHLWGILLGAFGRIRRAILAETLRLVWEATEASEWIGREDWIPFEPNPR